MINRITGPDIHILRGYARRGTAVILCSVLLGACALPMPVRIASWVADGIAYLTTEKSVTDHGISLVARKDCALWRGIKGEQICRDEGETAIAVAAAEGPPAVVRRRLDSWPDLDPVPDTWLGPGPGDSSDTWTLVALAPAAAPAEADAAALAGPETVFRDLVHRCRQVIHPTTAPGCRPTGRSTTMSTTACATSSSIVARCKGAERGASRPRSCSGSLVCCTSSACTLDRAVGLEVKPVGEPDAGNPHVRFDERGEETERCRMAQATAPLLDSTKDGRWRSGSDLYRP